MNKTVGVKAIKILLGALALILVLSVAATAYLALYLDQNRKLLEQGLSAALKRGVRIVDGIQVHWSLLPSVTVAGLRIANAEWAQDEDFLRAEGAVMRFDLRALLGLRLHVDHVALKNADVFLEVAADGRRNWVFDEESDSDRLLTLGGIEVVESRLHYRQPSGARHQVEFARLEVGGIDGETFNLEARFTYKGLPFTGSLTAGSAGLAPALGRPFQGELRGPYRLGMRTLLWQRR